MSVARSKSLITRVCILTIRCVFSSRNGVHGCCTWLTFQLLRLLLSFPLLSLSFALLRLSLSLGFAFTTFGRHGGRAPLTVTTGILTRSLPETRSLSHEEHFSCGRGTGWGPGSTISRRCPLNSKSLAAGDDHKMNFAKTNYQCGVPEQWNYTFGRSQANWRKLHLCLQWMVSVTISALWLCWCVWFWWSGI